MDYLFLEDPIPPPRQTYFLNGPEHNLKMQRIHIVRRIGMSRLAEIRYLEKLQCFKVFKVH